MLRKWFLNISLKKEVMNVSNNIEYFDFVVSEKTGFPVVIFKGGDESLFQQKINDVLNLYNNMEIFPQTNGDDDDSCVYRYGKRFDQTEYKCLPLK